MAKYGKLAIGETVRSETLQVDIVDPVNTASWRGIRISSPAGKQPVLPSVGLMHIAQPIQPRLLIGVPVSA